MSTPTETAIDKVSHWKARSPNLEGGTILAPSITFGWGSTVSIIVSVPWQPVEKADRRSVNASYISIIAPCTSGPINTLGWVTIVKCMGPFHFLHILVGG